MRRIVVCLFSVGIFLVFSSFAIASETTLYLGSVERIYDDAGNMTGEKIYIGAGSAVAVRTGNKQEAISNKTEYLYSDHLGSTVLATDEAGNKTNYSLYYPYGNTVNGTCDTKIDKLYTGQRKDFSSELYFYNARYYNPQTSHFISADKAEGPNRYAYVGNNPVMRNDPSGLRDMAETQGGGGRAGAPCTKCHTQPKPVYQDDYENYCRADGSGCGRNQRIYYSRDEVYLSVYLGLAPFAYLTGFGALFEMADTVYTGITDPAMLGMLGVAGMMPGPNPGAIGRVASHIDNVPNIAFADNFGLPSDVIISSASDPYIADLLDNIQEWASRNDPAVGSFIAENRSHIVGVYNGRGLPLGLTNMQTGEVVLNMATHLDNDPYGPHLRLLALLEELEHATDKTSNWFFEAEKRAKTNIANAYVGMFGIESMEILAEYDILIPAAYYKQDERFAEIFNNSFYAAFSDVPIAR